MAKFVLLLSLAFGFAVASPVSKEEKIINGGPAPIGAYPYQVSLRKTNGHFCGGSIISPYWILTAAHCTYQLYPNQIRVVVGSNYLNSGGWWYEVTQRIIHQNYNPNGHLYDASLLQVRGPIGYNQVVRPITLATSQIPGGYVCILSGWGSISYPNEVTPNELQHIQLRTISLAQCKNALPTHPIFPYHVCTFNGRGQGGCHGDSGGPLVCGNVQHGIVSWGIPCAQGAPDMYSSVAFFRGWIRYNSGV